MKLRLALVVTLFLPLLANAQQEDPTTNPGPKSGVIFYSKGKMYVKTKSGATAGTPAATTLYIDGSAKFATGSEIEQKGRTELTGNFVNAKDPSETEDAPHLFINNDPDDEDAGVIAFIGGLYDDDSSGPIIKRATRQWIYGDNSSGAWDLEEQKAKKYINFPTISVEKDAPGAQDDWRKVSLVTVDATAAVGVNYIKVATDKKNRFGVRSTYTTDKKITSGYALIHNTHSSLTTGIPQATYSQVDFNLYAYDEATNVDDGKIGATGEADPTTADKTLRITKDGKIWNHLLGFSPPFKELAADYMFYNVLTKPSGSSITSWQGPIVDPFYKMKAGYGYFMTMELSHNDHENNIDPGWDFEGDVSAGDASKGIHSSKRARGGYVFNRLTFEDYASAIKDETNNPLPGKIGGPQENFRRYTYDPANVKLPYDNRYPGALSPKFVDKNGKNKSRIELLQEEKFSIEPVSVELAEGLNFVGNPFMAPISLNCLLGIPMPSDFYQSSDADYRDIPYDDTDGFPVPMLGSGITASTITPAAGKLRAKYWLINQAYARYDAAKNIFLYKVTYNYISRFGSSDGVNYGDKPAYTDIPSIEPQEYLVSPMQMFALQTSEPVTITFSPAMRTFGKTRFPKSGRSDDTGEFKEFKRDWFIVEAQDEIDQLSDRTTVLFRDDALLQNKRDVFDTRKGLEDFGFDSYEQKGFVDINGFVSDQKQDVSKAILYTKSSDDVALLGNAVPKHTKELPLFFDKPEGTKPMKLKFYGIENIEAVPGVWLIDRSLDNKTIEVTPGFEYTFESTPADTDNLAGGNRFILRFYPDDKDVLNDENTPIVCYYNTSMLYIKGLIEDDINSDVTIYDMQGRLMARTKVNNAPTMEYLKPLSLGTYIVKIAGKRNHTAKFVNLQTK